MKVLHYVNQFFGGVGGEDHANDPPKVVDGAVGPGRALQAALGKRGNVVATIICGDNFSVEQADKTRAFVLDVIKKHQPDAVVAGPAFDAGRYGLACGLICQIAKQAGVHAVTAMQKDNPGVAVYRKDLVCVPTGANVAEMPKIMPRLADLAVKLASGQKLRSAAQEGYVPTGHRMDVMRDKTGAERAVEIVLARIHSQPFTSEIVIRDYDLVPPLPPMKTLRGVKVGIVTSGGLVPTGNPDRIPAARAEAFGRYDISKMPELKVGEWETIHGGYGHKYVNERDPNYVVPLRSLRELERRGEIGSIYPWYIATVGNQTAVNEAQKMGRMIAQEFKANGVGAVVLVPTWGSCNRCGATISKELERAGLPVAVISAIPIVAQTVGANRVVRGVRIEHVCGDPGLSPEGDRELNMRIVRTALRALMTKVDRPTIFEASDAQMREPVHVT